MKSCSVCGVMKDYSEFYESTTHRDGHRSECAKCTCLTRKLKRLSISNPSVDRRIKNLIPNERKCTCCKVIKDLSLFRKDSTRRFGIAYICLECTAIKNKAVREKDRKAYNKSMSDWKDSKKDRLKEKRYIKKYGINLNEYGEMYSSQEGKCAICNDSFESLVVDHCHKSGKVRGLLCLACNTALGFFRDKIASLESAILYLERS